MENTFTSHPTAIAVVACRGRGREWTSMLTVVLCVMAVGPAVWSAPAQAEASCPNEAARQGPSANLPECRAFEQVTPVNKGDAVDIFGSRVIGGEGIAVIATSGQAYVAKEGAAILIKTEGAFAPANASASAYVFSRGAEGWHMSVLAQPIDEPQEVESAQLFDPRDLSRVGFVDEIGTKSELFGADPSAFQQAEFTGPAGGPYAPLYSLSGFATFSREKRVEMAGGSEDLSRVILQSEDHSLAPGAEGQDAGTDVLYETIGGGECGLATSNCRLIDVNDEGESFTCGATLGQGEFAHGGAHSAVSSDGSRIFFTAPEPGEKQARPEGPGCWNPSATPQENPPELYMREGGTRTVEISVPHEAGVELGGENPLLPAVFVGASADGSKVFFMTRTELTKDDKGHVPELYEYNTEPGVGEKTLTRISHGESASVEGDVDSVTAVSSDGSAVYFSAYGNLASGASQYPTGTEDFSPVNLYRYDTTTQATTFITTLDKNDYPMTFGEESNWYSSELNGSGAEQEGVSFEKEWYTTGNGRFLVFGTVLPLTGFDNTEASGVKCPNNYNGNSEPPEDRCFELYRYDAATRQVVCVSCARGAPVDGAYFARTQFVSPAGGPPRPISEDGQHVFFESANALVPQATSGRVHVYEWHEGVISLISSRSDPGSAFLLGSSGDGNNVFFVTHAQLALQDTDQAADIYDARVGGGFAGLTPSQCTGTGCQGVPAAAPIFATPASATFAGVGNFPASEAAAKPPSKPRAKPKPCKRGFVKKHGRCVRKRTRKPAKKSTVSSRGGKK